MKVGIIGAMDSETGAIVHVLMEKYKSPISHYCNQNKLEFYEFNHEDVEVVICTCGCGKVNASLATTILIREYKCTDIVNIGCCGTMDKSVDVGSFMIPEKAIQYDCDTTGLGEERYMVQGTDGTTTYYLSSSLRHILAVAANSCDIDVCLFNCLAASGDTFLVSKNQKKYFGLNKINPQVVDMETAAIAHVCCILGARFASLRQVSDSCDAKVYEETKVSTSANLSDIILKFLELLKDYDEDNFDIGEIQ